MFFGSSVWTESSKVQEYCNAHCRMCIASMPHLVLLHDYRSYDFYRDISELSYRIFIAIFPVRAERYICAALALCKHDQFTASLLKFQHASVTCRKRRDACDCRPATVAEERLRPWKTSNFEVPCHRWSPCAKPSLWRHNSQLAACVYVRCGFQVSVVCSVWIENYESISLCTGLNILSVYN